MREVIVLGLVGLAGCGEVAKLPDAGVDAVPDSSDASPGAFGTPMPLTELNSSATDDDPTLTADLLEIFFDSGRSGGAGQGDIWVARRLSTSDPFGPPMLVAELASPADDTTPEVSVDGLTLYFASDRATAGNRELFVTTRPNRSAAWSVPVRIVELGSPQTDDAPIVSADGLTMYFSTSRAGNADIYKATRGSTMMPWGAPAAVAGVSDPTDGENQHWVSADGLSIYFTSIRGGGTDSDIWVATRPDTSAAFGPAVELAGVGSPANDLDPWLSADQRTIVFTSTRASGADDLYIATR